MLFVPPLLQRLDLQVIPEGNHKKVPLMVQLKAFFGAQADTSIPQEVELEPRWEANTESLDPNPLRWWKVREPGRPVGQKKKRFVLVSVCCFFFFFGGGDQTNKLTLKLFNGLLWFLVGCCLCFHWFLVVWVVFVEWLACFAQGMFQLIA